MKAILRDDHGDKVGSGSADSIIELVFEGREFPFTCLALPSRDGVDHDVELHFAEWTDDDGPEGLVFSAAVDRTTSRVRITPDPGPEIRGLLEEFNRDVTPEILAWIHDDAIRVVAHLLRSDAYDISVDEVLDRRRVAWPDVFRPGEPFDRKGTRSGFTIVSGGLTTYLVDSYCPDPGCDCGGVEIRGYRIVEGRDPRNPESVFDVTADLEGNVLDIVETLLPEKEVLTVFEDWRAGESALPAILADRYVDIKDLGTRVLETAED
jgi:hypothetical protein